MAGRKRKYTARGLQKAIDSYFAGISYEEPAVVPAPTGEVDEKGQVKWASRLVTGPDGKPLTVRRWLQPPSMAGLRLALGVTKETWSNYGEYPETKEIVERARAVMEDYWNGRLDGKGANGAKFALSACYGWSEKHSVEVNGSIEEYLKKLGEQGQVQEF